MESDRLACLIGSLYMHVSSNQCGKSGIPYQINRDLALMKRQIYLLLLMMFGLSI